MDDSEILNRLGIEVSKMQLDIVGLGLSDEALKERVYFLENKRRIEEPEKELKEIKLEVEYFFSEDCDPNHIRAKISPKQVEEIETFGIHLWIKNQDIPQEKYLKSLSRLGHLKIYYSEKNKEFVKSIVEVYRMLRKEEIDHLLNNGIKIEIVP